VTLSCCDSERQRCADECRWRAGRCTKSRPELETV